MTTLTPKERGRRIKEIREERGIPRPQLAAAAGRAPGWAKDVEGGVAKLTVEQLIIISDTVLKCDPRDLI